MPAAAERGFEVARRRRRPGIDQRHPASGLQHGRGDDVRTAEKVQIDVVHAGGQSDHRPVMWIVCRTARV